MPTTVAVDASLLVDDGAGGSRAASVNDFKTAATGGATESNLTALKNANHADLAALTTAVAALATDAHFQAFVAANHTDIAAVVAKLSGDPATQTTLAAVLAKLSSDPATQTTLAALVSANHTDLAALLAKNEAIRALLAGTLLVESRPATFSDPTYDADGNLTAWTENGVDYVASYDADGNVLTQAPA